MSKVHYQGEPSVILRDESHIFFRDITYIA